MKKNIKKTFDRIFVSSLLTTVTLFAGCVGNLTTGGENGSGKIEYAKLSDVEFWGALATEKVMQDNQKLYEGKKRKAEINLEVLPGEVESYQIIMSANEKPVKAYDIKLSDLTAGDKIFSAENISVAHEKYVYLGMPQEYYTKIGYYPDALVPFKNIKEHGENTVDAKENQGLYFSFTIPENQAEGTYTGNVKITIAGQDKEIPVSLKVGKVGITSETHVKSIFLNGWGYNRAELDTSLDTYDQLNKFIFKYRCGIGDILFKSPAVTMDSEIDLYVKYAVEYAQLKECPTYSIMMPELTNQKYEIDGEIITVKRMYNQALIEKYCLKMAYAGIENNVDTMAKWAWYGFDEPEMNGITAQELRVSAHILKQIKLNVAQKLRADSSITNTEMMEQIIASLMKVPHVVTQNGFGTSYDLEEYDFVYCPEFHQLQTDEARDLYRMEEGNELWWYGCTAPRNPYPSYHMDDTLVSARVLSWMQADYNISGNLYWATTAYGSSQEDYYDYDAWLGSYGEGILLYPGKKYGVGGPVPSIRLEAIRDGLEEYEFIYKLKELYKQSSKTYGIEVNAEKAMRRLYDDIYTGTKVYCSEDNMEVNRTRLIGLLNLQQTDAEICVTDIRDDSGKTYVDIVMKDGYQIEVKGGKLSGTRQVQNGKLYTYEVAPGEFNSFSFTYDRYGFGITINSSSSNFNAEYIVTNDIISQHKVSVESSLVNASTVVEGLIGKMVKLDFAAATFENDQIIHLRDVNSLGTIDATSDKFVMKIYNPTDRDIKIKLSAEYKNEPAIFNVLRETTLKPGMNEISLNNLSGYNWPKIKRIETLRITFGEKNDAARTLYLVDMTLYKI